MKFIFLFFYLSSSISQQLIDNEFNSNLNHLIKKSFLDSINQKYYRVLGRDKDPKIISDLTKLEIFFRKSYWEFITLPGLRNLTKLIYSNTTINHFNVDSAIAFTIDDGFCGLDNPNGCMVEEIKELFKSYNAHATFFIAGTHCININDKLVNSLIKDGHEIANHNMMNLAI